MLILPVLFKSVGFCMALRLLATKFKVNLGIIRPLRKTNVTKPRLINVRQRNDPLGRIPHAHDVAARNSALRLASVENSQLHVADLCPSDELVHNLRALARVGPQNIAKF
jgi:hypothetical protein